MNDHARPVLFKSIRSRMIALVVLPTLVIYVGVLGAALAHLRATARHDVEREMTRLADNYAARFDAAFREAAVGAVATARFLEIEPGLDEPGIFALLRAATERNPAIYGAAAAFEPAPGSQDLYSPYVYRGAEGLVEMNISRDVYDWYGDERWQWWHLPKSLGRGAWCDPYFDEGAGNVLMVTYSEPFFRKGAFAGVTTVDIMLPKLRQSIGREIVADLDFVILTGAGQYVYHPMPQKIMAGTIFDDAAAAGSPRLADLGRLILAGRPGVAAIDGWDSPDRQWVFFAPIRSTGWAFACRVSERVALAGVRSQMTVAALALAATLLLIVGSVGYVSGRIARPIEKLRAKVLEIAAGDLDARVEGIKGGDEVAQLAQSFNAMAADLRANLDRLGQEQAVRGRMERDLDIAREIQRGLLPKQTPTLPGFELAGWNKAADKTGGDYFDWLQFPDGRTILTLADVTGHGIGAALIVAVCRAYMRAATTGQHVELAEALGRVNDLLHADMPPGRFVTAVAAILDPAASRMTLISAGQAPILFYEAATGRVHSWEADVMPLGIAPGLEHPSPRDIAFGPGDILVLTSDGYFEWCNAQGEAYGTKRLAEFVRANHQRTPAELIKMLLDSVVGHAGNVPQADDLTAVVLKRQP